MVKEAVFRSLKTELEITEGESLNETLLQSKVDNAYEEVKAARNYPSSYSTQAIESDMEQYYSTIRGLALYDYNQIGAEGQISYNADGTSIRYLNRSSLFRGVLPIGGIL